VTKKLLIVEGTWGQVACAVSVDGTKALISEHGKAEDVGIDWHVVKWLGVVLALWMEPHVSFGCSQGLEEVFVNCLGI
jgi:hypothetical protein